MKICSKCKVEKPLAEFYTRKCGRITNPCKTCTCENTRLYNELHAARHRENARRWDAENQEWVKERTRLQRLANAETIKEKRLQWYALHKEEKKKESAEYKRKRLKADPLFRLFHRLRGRVRHALVGQLKASKTIELLGCSTEELRQHLEKQFRPNMTWENYGYRGWHVDHIKPCAKFDLSDPSQQRACFHYSNLQPLWAKENHSKGAKYGGN